MSTSRSTAEGVLAIALAIAVIAAAVVLGSDHSGEADLRSSTWVSQQRGARALFLVMESLGLDPVRVVDPPRADAPTDRTIVLLAPSWPVTKPETAALLDWVERGGRLVVVNAPSVPPALSVDVDALLTPLGLESRPAGGAALAVKVADESLARAAREVRWPARLVLGPIASRSPATPPDPGVMPVPETPDPPTPPPPVAQKPPRDARAGDAVDLVTNSEGTLATRVPFGAGEVVAVADESIFANDRLDEGDNAVLAIALVGGRPGGTSFDEYHHGFTPTGTRAGLLERIGALLVGTWIGRALLVLGLAGLVYAGGAGIRLGAPLPEPAEPRRSMREHADALGRLLDGAKASRESLTILVDGVRRTVATRIGLSPAATPADLCERLGRSAAPDAAELAAADSAATGAASRGTEEDAEFARLAANLGAAKRRFRHGGV